MTEAGPGDGRRLRGAAVDITERRELEEDLVHAGEKVRRDIGRELHDVLSSDLAALAMNADNLRRQVDETDVDAETVRDALDEIVQGIRAAAEQSRSLSHALIPAALQEQDLAAALETLCQEHEELGTPAPTFEEDLAEPLPENDETATHLYRIAREAVTNAQRHAEAEHIWVRLAREEDHLVLTIRDDGVGLSETADSEDGVGLRTMTYRAHLIGATLTVDSPEDGGTLVRCALPLRDAPAN